MTAAMDAADLRRLMETAHEPPAEPIDRQEALRRVIGEVARKAIVRVYLAEPGDEDGAS